MRYYFDGPTALRLNREFGMQFHGYNCQKYISNDYLLRTAPYPGGLGTEYHEIKIYIEEDSLHLLNNPDAERPNSEEGDLTTVEGFWWSDHYRKAIVKKMADEQQAIDEKKLVWPQNGRLYGSQRK